MSDAHWSDFSKNDFVAVLNSSHEICDDMLDSSPSTNFSGLAITYFESLTTNNIPIASNSSTIISNGSHICNKTIASNTSTPLNFDEQGSFYPPWLLYGGGVTLIPVGVLGCALNAFIIRVLSFAPDRSALDVIQMNIAICDALDGLLAVGAMVAASVIGSWQARERITRITALLFLFNITFEDLTTILLLVLRTRQVSAKLKWLMFSHLESILRITSSF